MPHGYRRVTSPLASKIRDPRAQELSKKEIELDREVLKWRRLIDVAKQAKKYQDKLKEDEELEKLTASWRDAAQKAAGELFEQASERIEQMGGISEFVRRQKENEEFQSSSRYGDNQIDYNSLTAEEKERYDTLKDEYEDEVGKKDEESGNDLPCEFTLKYMLNSLNIDCKLIYPEGIDE